MYLRMGRGLAQVHLRMSDTQWIVIGGEDLEFVNTSNASTEWGEDVTSIMRMPCQVSALRRLRAIYAKELQRVFDSQEPFITARVDGAEIVFTGNRAYEVDLFRRLSDNVGPDFMVIVKGDGNLNLPLVTCGFKTSIRACLAQNPLQLSSDVTDDSIAVSFKCILTMRGVGNYNVVAFITKDDRFRIHMLSMDTATASWRKISLLHYDAKFMLIPGRCSNPSCDMRWPQLKCCQGVRYCSSACQLHDRARHKKDCLRSRRGRAHEEASEVRVEEPEIQPAPASPAPASPGPLIPRGFLNRRPAVQSAEAAPVKAAPPAAQSVVESPPVREPLPICGGCQGMDVNFRCCPGTWYCDTACQRAHWKEHKHTCSRRKPKQTLAGGAGAAARPEAPAIVSPCAVCNEPNAALPCTGCPLVYCGERCRTIHRVRGHLHQPREAGDSHGAPGA